MVKLKVYELAKQLGIDNQYLVEICKRLGIDIKNTMSVLGSEEVKSVREFYERNRAVSKKEAPPAGGPAVTEKRVGSNVIRRRASAPAAGASAASEGADTAVEEPEVPVAAASAPAEEGAEPEAAKKPAKRATARTGVKRHKLEDVLPPPPAPKVVEETPGEVPQAAAPTEEAPAAAPETEAAAPAAVADAKKKRSFPSIIKKVSVETHLTENFGPKMAAEKKKAATPATDDAGGLRRVKEVHMTPAPTVESAREAGRRRILERQSAVFRSADFLKRELVHATKKKKNTPTRAAQKTMITTPAEHKRVLEMGEKIAVAEAGKQLGLKAGVLIKKLMEMGVTASLNESIDYDTAVLLAHEFGWEVKQQVFKETEFIPAFEVAESEMQTRAPVVTIMGHVDHGKTSLLDSIRKANVAQGEAGGITQHIGAYTVSIPKKGTVAFVDTPGHEAFTEMRARGAKVTDIVVLVVSAVDGVMPQTLESVDHAKAAGVPIVVAVNKIDLPDANADRIKQTLAGHDLAPEDWGGSTIYVNVSAKTGQGIPELLDSILVQAEVLELKAPVDCPAKGVVIESRLDKNRGSIATVLVQQGTLKSGDIVVAGTAFGKVRAMSDCYGKPVREAGPSTPVEILGLSEAAPVGAELFAVEDERAAKTLVQGRLDQIRNAGGTERPKLTLEEMLAGDSGTKELRLIIKSDVVGSLEAIKVALTKIPDDKVKIRILHTATGGITESDINLAVASQAVVVGFNVRPDGNARKRAESEKVEIRTYSIIYEIVDEVKNLMEGLLDRTVKETVIGHAEVRNVFNIPKVGTIAGSSVTDGKVIRGCYLRLLRDSRVVYEGKVSSLRRFKDDVKEVAQGYECGIGLENFNDLKMGDRFEAFLKEEVKGSL